MLKHNYLYNLSLKNLSNLQIKHLLHQGTKHTPFNIFVKLSRTTETKYQLYPQKRAPSNIKLIIFIYFTFTSSTPGLMNYNHKRFTSESREQTFQH